MTDTPTTLSPAPEAPEDDGGGHTKLPWAVSRYGEIVAGPELFRVAEVEHISISRKWQDEHDEHWGAHPESHRDVPEEEWRANAHLIVTAVNAFASNKRLIDDLVAAVEKITKAWDRPGRLVDKFYDTDLSKAVEEARSAPSKAKAKPGERK